MKKPKKKCCPTLLQIIAENEIKRLEGEKKYHDPANCGRVCNDECDDCGWNASKDQDIAYWKEEIELIK